MRKHVTLIGGYFTPEAALESAANTLCDFDAVGDVDIFSFLYTMENPAMVARAMKRGIALSDSAGALALGTALGEGIKDERLPRRMVTCDGVEPRSPRQLTMGLWATRRNCLAIKQEGGPRGEGYGRLIDTFMEEMQQHPLEYLNHLAPVTRFSTIQLLRHSMDNGIPSAAIVSANDELCPYTDKEPYGRIPVYLHEGGHARFLVEPETVLPSWAESL